jgi:hypothetical protein
MGLQERIIEDGGVHLLIDLLYDTLNAPANVRDIKVRLTYKPGLAGPKLAAA